MAGGEDGPKLLDMDTLVDEILAKKGPQQYKDGLTEENWEEVSLVVSQCHYSVTSCFCGQI